MSITLFICEFIQTCTGMFSKMVREDVTVFTKELFVTFNTYSTLKPRA